jgi:hypothetical protein
MAYYQSLFTSSTLNEIEEHSDIAVKSIDVYSITSVYMGTINYRRELERKYKSGIFILRYKDVESKVLCTEKIMIKQYGWD